MALLGGPSAEADHQPVALAVPPRPHQRLVEADDAADADELAEQGLELLGLEVVLAVGEETAMNRHKRGQSLSLAEEGLQLRRARLVDAEVLVLAAVGRVVRAGAAAVIQVPRQLRSPLRGVALV